LKDAKQVEILIHSMYLKMLQNVMVSHD
jgi:hypothetical protein